MQSYILAYFYSDDVHNPNNYAESTVRCSIH